MENIDGTRQEIIEGFKTLQHINKRLRKARARLYTNNISLLLAACGAADQFHGGFAGAPIPPRHTNNAVLQRNGCSGKISWRQRKRSSSGFCNLKKNAYNDSVNLNQQAIAAPVNINPQNGHPLTAGCFAKDDAQLLEYLCAHQSGIRKDSLQSIASNSNASQISTEARRARFPSRKWACRKAVMQQADEVDKCRHLKESGRPTRSPAEAVARISAAAAAAALKCPGPQSHIPSAMLDIAEAHEASCTRTVQRKAETTRLLAPPLWLQIERTLQRRQILQQIAFSQMVTGLSTVEEKFVCDSSLTPTIETTATGSVSQFVKRNSDSQTMQNVQGIDNLETTQHSGNTLPQNYIRSEFEARKSIKEKNSQLRACETGFLRGQSQEENKSRWSQAGKETANYRRRSAARCSRLVYIDGKLKNLHNSSTSALHERKEFQRDYFLQTARTLSCRNWLRGPRPTTTVVESRTVAHDFRIPNSLRVLIGNKPCEGLAALARKREYMQYHDPQKRMQKWQWTVDDVPRASTSQAKTGFKLTS